MNCEQSFTEIDLFLFLRHCLTKPAVSWVELVLYLRLRGGDSQSLSLCVCLEKQSLRNLERKVKKQRSVQTGFSHLFPPPSSKTADWQSLCLNVVTKFHKLLHCGGSKYDFLFIYLLHRLHNILAYERKEQDRHVGKIITSTSVAYLNLLK